MISKIITLLLAATFSVQALAALNNPFNKTTSVTAGANVKWDIKKGVAKKTSTTSDNDGTFYQLKVTQNQLSLHLLSSTSGAIKSFDQLTIDDVQLDGKTSALFQWCLNNQQSHNRFLQQGLKIKKDICHNKGQDGMFLMKLNRTTYDLLKSTQDLTFIIKPYRSAVVVTFDVSDISNVYAKINSVGASATKKVEPKKPAVKLTPKPAMVKKPVAAAVAVKPKPKAKKVCSIKPPLDFSSIRVVKYNCDDAAEKAKARKQMAVSVKKARDEKDKQAADQKKSKQTEAEKLALEEKKRKEAEAVLNSEKNTNKIRNEVSERMIGMCKKKWAEGEHRCYCEPYLEFAPAGISSDASCSGS